MKKFYKTTIMMMICLFIAHSAFADVSADFTANQTTIVAGETIQFTDLSSGNPTTWQWDFQNDGTIDSEEQNPNFTYNEAGTYSVSLAVSDGTNEDTELKVDYITVENTTWQCGDPFTDTRDEQTYNSALIGGQCWMAENLNIGTMINGNTNMTNNSVIEKYCYDNDLANCEIYGGLYQWNEMMQYVTDTVVQGICPESWHLPTDFEWKILEGTVDSQYPVGDPIWNNIGSRGYDAGINLKSTTGWNINTGTDAFGFTALPAGCRNSSGDFNSLGYYGYFWSSAEGSTSNAWSRYLGYSSGSVDRLDYGKSYGFSVRCLQDEYIPQEKTVTTEANPPEGGTTAGE